MNKILRLSLLLTVLILFSRCNSDDGPGVEPLRDYSVQYVKDLADIEEFLKTNSYTVVSSPGTVNDQDVVFTEIPENDNTTVSIWDSGDLLTREVEQNDITYKIYYLKLREGGGALNDKPFPCNVDKVLASYRGSYLFHDIETTTVDGVTTTTDTLKSYEFETVTYPQTSLGLDNVIRGWSEIFPQFRAGDFTNVSGEPTSYSDFGAGVMFIPSGLAYYNQAQANIPKYSPLIFKFKLYEVTRQDQDSDGIPSYLEDLDGDRYMYIKEEGVVNPDDSPLDEDEAPDYLDADDDGDLVLTSVELLNESTTNDLTDKYDYFTVPDCNGNTSDPARIRRFRDNNCYGQP